MAVVANAAAFAGVVVFWVYSAALRCRGRSAEPNLWLRNFLYLWVTNVAGFGELVLLNPIRAIPVGLDAEDLFVRLIFANTWVLAAYGIFVVTLSTFTFNFAYVRIAEDLFLVAYGVF